MCIAMTEIRNDCLAEGRAEGRSEGISEGATNRAIEIARNMLAGGKLALEDVAEYSGLPLEKVKELATQN